MPPGLDADRPPAIMAIRRVYFEPRCPALRCTRTASASCTRCTGISEASRYATGRSANQRGGQAPDGGSPAPGTACDSGSSCPEKQPASLGAAHNVLVDGLRDVMVEDHRPLLSVVGRTIAVKSGPRRWSG